MRGDQRCWLGVVASGAVGWSSEVCVPVVLQDGENLTCGQMGNKVLEREPRLQESRPECPLPLPPAFCDQRDQSGHSLSAVDP